MKREEEALRVLTILLRASGSVTNMLKKDMLTYGMNPTEFAVLEVLFSLGKQPIQIIGKKVLLASSSTTYVIDQLEKKGLVERVQSEDDRRVTLVSLTDEGQELMESIFPQHSQVIKQLFEELSDEELYELGESLKTVGYKAVDLYDTIEDEA
ncbi:transcriptional regulator, MarR family [Atopostipes suicloacalis DSM 15692]|uniref:Transcriptional regulator, MarR family n=1 Tax=Atopostipes suicloacalis DSM 15692 TaxID=1121025 RepID=A0A1M4TDK2_9LACT|nr:MarR family transcriptional regulator [Atopostipes suicloacalis]SHE42454.1 transcriptional regulator, MarR family [Atopostipes suicloacalis DSM 15692]